jgi:alkylation response protein AidB-like acyl-CoA dehydrogenase
MGGPIAPTYFNWRKTSIYGGTNEIQKNIIAKAILGFDLSPPHCGEAESTDGRG